MYILRNLEETPIEDIKIVIMEVRERKWWLLVVVAMVVGSGSGSGGQKLDYDYYKFSCPNLDKIMREEMLTIFLTDPSAPPAFLRLIFHDCQVQGCDASIMLGYNDILNQKDELASSKNFGIRKLEKIEHIKSILEEECPGQVSCADIIVLAAKEAVQFSGGPEIQVPLGRKDAITSSNKQADAHIPSVNITVDKLLSLFMSKGMNLEESVAMMGGGHTLGVGHCTSFVDRLYDRQRQDPINYGFEVQLRLACPTRKPLTNLTFVPNDMTPVIFDNQYYRDILMDKGLFGIDSSISRDPRTAPIVENFAVNQDSFFQVFSSAFFKLSLTNVTTQVKGEARRKCSEVK